MPVDSQDRLFHQLQEFHLIRSSLMSGEHFSFVLPPEDTVVWSSLLDAQTYNTITTSLDGTPCQARFFVQVQNSHVWFEIQVPDDSTHFRWTDVFVRGENISRDLQEFWQSTIQQKMDSEVQESEFPMYDLLVLHLLPMLHECACGEDPVTPTEVQIAYGAIRPTNYHALLTSHHLMSATKRRLMRQWSSELTLSGLAKTGHPGVIYTEGGKENVDEFVKRVKAMQWLALRVRFVEPVEPSPYTMANPGQGWIEVEKISEVLQEMQKLGRVTHMTNFGIGCSSK
ncbi:hypothetical protein J3A83DRAFT_4188391 [Scleroderma citrinum]